MLNISDFSKKKLPTSMIARNGYTILPIIKKVTAYNLTNFIRGILKIVSIATCSNYDLMPVYSSRSTIFEYSEVENG